MPHRQLFFYWRVAPADAAPALQAMQQLQRELAAGHRGLQVEMYQRSGGNDAHECTLMESYRFESAGIDDALLQTIRQRGDDVLQRWLRGARHLEVFERCRG